MRATDRQITYLRALLIEAFSRRYPTIYDYNHLENVRRDEASVEIDRLKGAKSRGWPKGEPLPRYSAPGPWDHLSDEDAARYKAYRRTEPMAHVVAWRAAQEAGEA